MIKNIFSKNNIIFKWYESKIIKEKYLIINIIIKYLIFIIIYLILFYYKYIYINIKEIIKVEIDNKFEISLYENNLNFSNYLTDIKPIAIYYPEFNNIKYFNNYYYNLLKNKDNKISEIILKQIDLAKSHGLYGFGIIYVFGNTQNIYNSVVDFFSNNKIINFHFLLIWKNDNFGNYLFDILENKLNNFIKNIKKYLVSKNYIKINNKPAIFIENPFIFEDINETILILREKARNNGIGEIYVVFPINKYLNDSKYIQIFDAVYDLSKFDFLESDDNKQNIYYYSGILYKNIIYNNIKKNFTLFRTTFLEYNNSIKNIFKDYTLEKYYILNNIIIDWTKINYNITNGFIFIDSWNNYLEGNYLEPNEDFGYASINCFSKALFNLPFKENNYNLIKLETKCIIAVQAHIYYVDLINEIINKTNNIPIKFDLLISTISLTKKKKIEKYLKLYSKANKYEVKIVENKGRDILPFITQMKFKFKNYKYICHIHTKKSKHDILLGSNWRNFLYENLLGTKEIISEILIEFENYEKLGFMFPEAYYQIIKNIDNYDLTEFPLHKPNIKYMNFILSKIFYRFKIGNKIIFPSGDMFWAKVNAIYQIFKIRFINKFPKEFNQTNETIMHAIERIWLYLVKLNGYYYKIIFKHY